MTRTRHIAVVLAVLLAVSATAPAGVTAQDNTNDEGFFDGLVTSDDDDGDRSLVDRARDLVASVINPGRTIDKYLGDQGEASEHADAFQAEFNDNNETLFAYANERLNASTSYDVLRLEFHDRSGGGETRYLVATVNTTTATYESAEIVANTSRPVDHTVSADWYVSRHAAGELEQFVAEYADPGEDLGAAYRANMLRKYGRGINGTLWGGA